MKYINTQTKAYPVSEQDIRNAFPNVSFPTPFKAVNYAVVFPSPQPAYNPISQSFREIAPVLTNKGTWEQRWEVVDLDAETVAVNTEAARKALIPVSVSPRQIRMALTAANLRSQVEDAVAAGNQDLKDWWEFSITVERNHPMVVGMAESLGVSSTDLDDLFIAAAAL